MSALSLTVGQYRLRYRALDAVKLPRYTGSAWRGVFGHALKQTVCVTRERECSDCMLYFGCAYAYIFETPPPPDSTHMRQYPAAPHPFVIYPGMHTQKEINPGDEMAVELLVYGQANRHLPYLIYAFQQALEKGIGRSHGTCRLIDVEQNQNVIEPDWICIWKIGGRLEPIRARQISIPECPQKLKIKFISPMRIKRNGRLVGQEEFQFHDLFRNLLRRISMLSYFHASQSLQIDYAALNHASRDVVIKDKELHWLDWTRFSSRQDTTMQMGGLTGWIDLGAQDLSAFWPYLWYGQWTHAGKGTVMGLGRYRLLDLASLRDPSNSLV